MEISPDGTILISVLAEDIIDGVCREIPPSVTHIGARAFEGCQALRAIIIDGSEQEVRNIRGQLPQELQSRAISLTRYKEAELIRQKVLVSAEPIGSLPKLPDALVQYINQYDERVHQAVNQEQLPAIDEPLEN
jgi:hypothetical protein